MSNKPSLNRFDKIAPFYDGMTKLIFGGSILKAQRIHLRIIPREASILVLGGGSGNWLVDFLKEKPTCKIWYVEASLVMLEKATQKLNFSNNIQFIHGTHLDIPKTEFDVVITHFFVDMFREDQIMELAQQMSAKLKINGVWLVADFVNKNYWHRFLLWLMYRFFKIIDAIDVKSLPDWDQAIRSKHFTVGECNSFYGQFIQSSVYSCDKKVAT